jgi:hypothetical protein
MYNFLSLFFLDRLLPHSTVLSSGNPEFLLFAAPSDGSSPTTMPTANEVDTRPVAVGKWPRHHHNSHHYMSDRYLHRQQQQSGRRKCGTDNDDNCVQKYDSGTCLDVLLRPELLHEIYGDRGQSNLQTFLTQYSMGNLLSLN